MFVIVKPTMGIPVKLHVLLLLLWYSLLSSVMLRFYCTMTSIGIGTGTTGLGD